jgi:hypothetical protein
MRALLEQIRSARALHARWRLHFMSVVEQGRSDDARRIANAIDCCPLGVWLLTPMSPRIEVAADELVAVAARHAEFHREAELLAELLAAGHGDEARRGLLPTSAFGAASERLMQALLALYVRLEAALLKESAASDQTAGATASP